MQALSSNRGEEDLLRRRFFDPPASPPTYAAALFLDIVMRVNDTSKSTDGGLQTHCQQLLFLLVKKKH